MEVTEWRASGTVQKGRARRMEKEVPRRPWRRGGTGGEEEKRMLVYPDSHQKTKCAGVRVPRARARLLTC